MTGSLLLNRQHSSTAVSSVEHKVVPSKLRRGSSADEQHLLEVLPDENQYKEVFPVKRNQTPSDIDSGVEDLDQQPVTSEPRRSSNKADQEEPATDFGACVDGDNEGYSTPVLFQSHPDDEQQQLVERIRNDLALAIRVPDHEKKDFCQNTMEVFHGEFARRLAIPVSLNFPGVRYHLFTEEDFDSDPSSWPGFSFARLDNAKAQFKCTNSRCGRLWTSMRARISFKISQPLPCGFVVLKVYGQVCEHCQAWADPLWYIEEVCRVMKNLSVEILQAFFPSIITHDDLQATNAIQTYSTFNRRSRHDPHQRAGNMRARHNHALCEACQHGVCYM